MSRILHIIPTLGNGGAEALLVQTVKELKRRGISSDILVLSKVDLYNYEFLKLCAENIFVGNINNVYSFRQIFLIKKFILNNNYQFVHTHLFGAQLFTACAKRILRKDETIYLTTEHSTKNKRRGKILGKIIDEFSYNAFSKIVAISHGVRENLINSYPSLENKVMVIYNGIDVKRYESAIPYQKSYLNSEFNETDILLLMVANFKESKDHRTLIDAHALLDEKYKLLFVGNGKTLAYYMEYVKKKNYRNVFFLGNRNDVPQILKTCDIFILSSNWEGFGLVTVEAAASGLPIIGSDIEGLKEVIQKLDGKLFGNKNVYELYTIIKETKINKKIVSEQLDKFTIESMVKQYMQLYSLSEG